MNRDSGLWARLLDALFPPRCVFCRRVTVREEPVCPRCRRHLPWLGEERWDGAQDRAFDGFCAPLSYEGLVRRAILYFKETGSDWDADCFAQLMLSALEKQFPGEEFSAVVPVPTTPKKRAERGFNQTELLSGRIAGEKGIPHRPDALQRLEETKVQHRLSARGRYQNASFSYCAGEGELGGTVLLIDDVATTGATLHACALALKGMGARRVIALSAAATLKKTRNPVEKVDKNRYNILL